MGFISNPKTEPKQLNDMIEYLESNKIKLFFDPHTAKKIKQKPTKPGDMNVDLGVLVGGDGTFLWGANKLNPGTLLLPVNAGDLGYLAEISLEQGVNGLERIFGGDYFVEKRTKIIINNKYEVLNEAIICPTIPATLLELEITLDDSEKIKMKSDGVLVATPTGSTAYSFSLGNPVIHPDTKAYLIAPISPMQRDQPSIVVPSHMKTRIRLLSKEKEANLILDGRYEAKHLGGDFFELTESINTADFIRFNKDFKHHYVNIAERRRNG